ncbi:hypothetical protein Plhal710r2_c011g0049811 [Plasmopara halstedii]
MLSLFAAIAVNGNLVLLSVYKLNTQATTAAVRATSVAPLSCVPFDSYDWTRYVLSAKSSSRNSDLITIILDPETNYAASLKALIQLQFGNEKLTESLYPLLLYKALREGRNESVWNGYKKFLNDERQGRVAVRPRARTTWPILSDAKMQMQRFVLWAMLDTHRIKAMEQFYQSEVVGKYNRQGIHEADSLNFLLRMECTSKVIGQQEEGLRLRLETLLKMLEQHRFHTSYSSSHALFRLIVHRSEVFEATPSDEENAKEAYVDKNHRATATGEMIIEYIERFPCAMALDPRRISIAISAAAAAGQHDAAELLLQYGLKHRVPISAGSFAHAVEGAPDDKKRSNIADLYVHAKECDLIYTTEGSDGSIVNHLLFYAIMDGNFKHTIELLHEMQLNRTIANNRTVRELFRSIARYRAHIRKGDDRKGASKLLIECPTILGLLKSFPNVIPCTVHSLSQGILQSLYAGDLAVALEIMRVACFYDVKLRAEIYSQLLYPLLASGQRGGDESSDECVFDCLQVEQCFDQQYPNEHTHLKSLVVNICQANDDFTTMLVCLDRWQVQGHPPMSRRMVKRVFEVISKQIQKLQKRSKVSVSGTVFVVNSMELSYLAFLVRYRSIVTWDSWTIERAIIRARTSGLYADVMALMAEASSRGWKLSSTAYIVSLCVLEEVCDPLAVVACVETIKANDAWEKVKRKDPGVQNILSRAIANGILFVISTVAARIATLLLCSAHLPYLHFKHLHQSAIRFDKRRLGVMAELEYTQMLQGMQSEEAKRARQREHVKNSYYRKQNLVKALRIEASELELKYARTFQLKQQQLEWRDVAGALGCEEERNHSDDLVEQYMQLSIKKQQLVRENKELERMTSKFSKFQLKMQQLVDSEPKVKLESPSVEQENDMVLEPFTVSECHQLASHAFGEIAKFMKHNTYLTSGLELFGWREQRREEPDHVKFTLKKYFIGHTPLNLSLRAWRVVSSPRGLAGLYSSAMRLSLKVLQVVDDYNVIMYRVITNPTTLGTVKSLFLVSRFQMDTGYIILFRSIDRNRLRKFCSDGTIADWDTEPDKWLDMFTWTLFEEDLDNINALTFSYGGIVYSTKALTTRVWMLEILSLALRWENKVVGPPLMLSS